MMKLTGKISDIAQDFVSKKIRLTFEVLETEAAKAGYNELKDKELLEIQVKPWRKKRSLDANAYAWVLIDRLSEVLQESKEDIYRHAIKNIGGNTDIVCVVDAAVEPIRNAWQRHGLGWQTEVFDSKLDGCTNIVLYYGSSTYDTKQMSVFIDRLVQDCKAVGIETMSPCDLESLLERWGE